jgi:hypothetical protein
VTGRRWPRCARSRATTRPHCSTRRASGGTWPRRGRRRPRWNHWAISSRPRRRWVCCRALPCRLGRTTPRRCGSRRPATRWHRHRPRRGPGGRRRCHDVHSRTRRPTPLLGDARVVPPVRSRPSTPPCRAGPTRDASLLPRGARRCPSRNRARSPVAAPGRRSRIPRQRSRPTRRRWGRDRPRRERRLASPPSRPQPYGRPSARPRGSALRSGHGLAEGSDRRQAARWQAARRQTSRQQTSRQLGQRGFTRIG